MVNRSVSWADWDEELLALELQDIQELDFDLSLTGFDPGEIDDLLGLEDDEKANAAPPLPESPVTRLGDLWLLGQHRVLCGDATFPEPVARLLGERKPRLMVSDPPYGISLDSEWRDRAGLNGCGPAEASYMKNRTEGHTETTISGDTRADWSDAFALVPSLEVAYVWHASVFTREVLDGLLFGTRAEQCSRARIIGISMSRAGTSERRTRRGSGRQARIPLSGIRHRPSSSWVDPMRRSSIIPRKSQSS